MRRVVRLSAVTVRILPSGPLAPRELRESVIVSEIMMRRSTATDAAALADLAAETFPLACPPHTIAEAIAGAIAPGRAGRNAGAAERRYAALRASRAGAEAAGAGFR